MHDIAATHTLPRCGTDFFATWPNFGSASAGGILSGVKTLTTLFTKVFSFLCKVRVNSWIVYERKKRSTKTHEATRNATGATFITFATLSDCFLCDVSEVNWWARFL